MISAQCRSRTARRQAGETVCCCIAGFWSRIIGETMAFADEPYIQVGDMILLARVAALVRGGKLLADGDPWDTRSSRVRLPGNQVDSSV
jgi:hypothetical protein